jgi:hypothetical protein
MICKINLMGVPLQVEDLLFSIDRKKQRKRGCFAWGRRATSGTAVQIWPNVKKGGAKARRLQVSKLWMTLQVKMNLQEHATNDPHHASPLWQEVK